MNLGALTLRQEGIGYRAIARMLGIPVDRVVRGVFQAKRERVRQGADRAPGSSPTPPPLPEPVKPSRYAAREIDLLRVGDVFRLTLYSPADCSMFELDLRQARQLWDDLRSKLDLPPPAGEKPSLGPDEPGWTVHPTRRY